MPKQRWRLIGGGLGRVYVDDGPPLEMGETVEVVAVADVLEVLENGYHPQNPSTAHPVDVIEQWFAAQSDTGERSA